MARATKGEIGKDPLRVPKPMAGPSDDPIPRAPLRPPYQIHLFVCTSGPDCPVDGPAEEIRSVLKKEVKSRGLQDELRVNRSGCLGQCGHGPMMVVYPEGAWYAHLGVEQAQEVLRAHLDGQPQRVLHHRFAPGPGGNKAPRDETGKRHCDGGCRAGAASH